MIWVYSSLPLKGSQRQESNAIIDGIRLAFRAQGGRVASYVINYKSLDDAAGRAGWSSKLAVRNAVLAAGDPRTVAYIGDLDSGATELSLPILNQAGVVQITPGSGYPGLTDSVPPVTMPAEPAKFYPTRRYTLLRLIPNDMVQAAAALELLHSTGCVHVAAASFDGGVDGPALVHAIQLTAKDYSMAYVSPAAAPGTKTSAYPSYALKLREAGVGCFVFAGHVTPAAVALTERIHAELPTGAIIGSSGFCSRAWTDPARHGASAAVDPYLYCTSPVVPARKYPGAGPFVTDFRQVYHRTPEPYALIGYRAAEMVIAGIDNLANGRDNRREVLRAIGGVSIPSPVVGDYGFNPHGDLASHAYGIYRVVDGRPAYDKTLTPPRVL
jgi:branched-chain amino acid transport system substrate-binding protein